MSENKKILELIMIVKNSGEVLRECLIKNREYIDHWTICDTGSTDNTKEIILEELSKVPGNLYSIDFEDFSQARNKSIELSSKTCKYSIILDDSYYIMGGDLLRQKLQKSKTKAFIIKIGTLSNNVLTNYYFSTRIFKTSAGYKYKYRVHEFLQVKLKEMEDIIDDKIFIDDIETVEHKNRSVIRYKNDIRLLLLDLKEYPTEPRIIYYLAKTNYQIENLDDALLYFKKLQNLKKALSFKKGAGRATPRRSPPERPISVGVTFFRICKVSSFLRNANRVDFFLDYFFQHSPHKN